MDVIYFPGLFLAYVIGQAVLVRFVLARVGSSTFRTIVLLTMIAVFPAACWLAAAMDNGGGWAFGLLAIGSSLAALIGGGAGYMWYSLARSRSR